MRWQEDPDPEDENLYEKVRGRRNGTPEGSIGGQLTGRRGGRCSFAEDCAAGEILEIWEFRLVYFPPLSSDIFS